MKNNNTKNNMKRTSLYLNMDNIKELRKKGYYSISKLIDVLLDCLNKKIEKFSENLALNIELKNYI